MLEFTGVIKRQVVVGDDAFRVELSPYGCVVYRMGARKPHYDISWERMIGLGNKSSGKSKRGTDVALHIQRIYLELDTIAAELRVLTGRKEAAE